jgi:high-affinity nickel-transport protein
MLNLLLTFVVSLLLGMRHATDVDHVVAVSTIVSQERSMWRASRVGAVWGLGHTLTIFLIGGAIILFKLALTPRLGLSMEMTVALMLVVLGTLNLFDVRVGSGRAATVRPFVVGAVHGMAGSAAATLLILPLIDDARWAVLYLVVFGIGTMAGMALITAAIAAPALYRPARMKRLERSIRLASGAVSVTFGLYLGYKIGFVDGLFTGHVNWSPR